MTAEHPGWRAGSHGGASLAPDPRAARRSDRGAGQVAGSRRPAATDEGGRATNRMLRIIHTADVHLGARHDDLGEQAAAQRERQFAAFAATVDMAIAEQASTSS